MSTLVPRFLVVSLIVAGASLTRTASAHLTLTSPPARVGGEAGGNQLKQGPCGQANNARTDTVTTFAPGEVITVEFNEYIDHDSYYRVAFDDDGDNDFPMPPPDEAADSDPEDEIPLGPNVLAYFKEGRNGDNAQDYSMEVTLPNTPCTNCTLQVIQYMYGSQNPYYYQCADIVIEGDPVGAGGAGGAGGAAGAAGASGGSGGQVAAGSGGAAAGQAAVAGGGSGGTLAVAGAPGTAGVSSVAGTAGTMAGTAGAAGAPSAIPAEGEDEGGCALSADSTRHRDAAWLLGLIGLGVFWRRRSRG